VRPPVCRGSMRQEEDVLHAKMPGRQEDVCKDSYLDPRSGDFLVTGRTFRTATVPRWYHTLFFSTLFGRVRNADISGEFCPAAHYCSSTAIAGCSSCHNSRISNHQHPLPLPGSLVEIIHSFGEKAPKIHRSKHLFSSFGLSYESSVDLIVVGLVIRDQLVQWGGSSPPCCTALFHQSTNPGRDTLL